MNVFMDANLDSYLLEQTVNGLVLRTAVEVILKISKKTQELGLEYSMIVIRIHMAQLIICPLKSVI